MDIFSHTPQNLQEAKEIITKLRTVFLLNRFLISVYEDRRKHKHMFTGKLLTSYRRRGIRARKKHHCNDVLNKINKYRTTHRAIFAMLSFTATPIPRYERGGPATVGEENY